MELNKALSQIHEIHEQLARGEVYRDYRAVPIACSGLIALAAAAAAPWALAGLAPRAAVPYWGGVAVLGALVAAGGIVGRYLRHSDARARRQTRIVIGQLIPSLAAGLLLAAVAWQRPDPWLELLPGLWTLLFGLSIFASRPYLPRMIGFVGLYYFAAGALLLTAVAHPTHPWCLGLTFGVGQALSGLVLYWNLERGQPR